MKKIWKWYNGLSNRIKRSVSLSAAIIGGASAIMTVTGASLQGWTHNIWVSLAIIVGAFIVFSIIIYGIIGQIYKDSVSLTVSQTPVFISCGDIFETEGYKVIGCDTHFDTRVDDIVVQKDSLHGQLVLKHGDKEEIEKLVENKGQEFGLKKNEDGLYEFPLGTVIRYDSKKDKQTYLMLAMTRIVKEGDKYKSRTSMPEFEQMLMHMWDEIDGLYAGKDVVLPILGSGISRFKGGTPPKENLLKCMLCTFNASGVSLNSSIKIVIYGDAKDIPLYEYKDMFRSI